MGHDYFHDCYDGNRSDNFMQENNNIGQLLLSVFGNLKGRQGLNRASASMKKFVKHFLQDVVSSLLNHASIDGPYRHTLTFGSA